MVEPLIGEVVIADMRVGSDQFPFGELFQQLSDVEFELQRVIPLESSVIPLLWVVGGTTATTKRTIESDPLAENVKILTQTGDRCLFEVKWNPVVNGFFQSILENDGYLLHGKGTPEVWEFRVQFGDRRQLQSCFDDFRSNSVSVDFHRIFNPTWSSRGEILTEHQWEAVRRAHNAGYWEVPRQTTLVEIAADLEISDAALSERLRRGVNALIDAHSRSDGDDIR